MLIYINNNLHYDADDYDDSDDFDDALTFG